jgi:hypothetical protein
MKTVPTHIHQANSHKLDTLEKSIKPMESQIKFQWIAYKEAKVAYWDYYRIHYIYLHPDTGGHLALPILIMWLLAVYFLDLVFSYNIAEYQAKQSFHGNHYAIVVATLVFPLAFVAAEIFINFMTDDAKKTAELHSFHSSNVWKYRAWIVASIGFALVIPVLYIMTGFAGMAKSGNPIFIGLLFGLTLMVGIVHLVTIFAGDQMVLAKERIVSIWGYNRRKKRMQATYNRLVKMTDYAEGLYRDYGRLAIATNGSQGSLFMPISPSELVRYIIRYIARDYYHIPAGEEPGFDDRDDDDDLHPPRSIAG